MSPASRGSSRATSLPAPTHECLRPHTPRDDRLGSATPSHPAPLSHMFRFDYISFASPAGQIKQQHAAVTVYAADDIL